MRLSQSLEDYLKVIYVLEADGEKATTTAIAQALEVSNASVTNMLKKLAGMNLIVHESYKGAELSPAGKKSCSGDTSTPSFIGAVFEGSDGVLMG